MNTKQTSALKAYKLDQPAASWLFLKEEEGCHDIRTAERMNGGIDGSKVLAVVVDFVPGKADACVKRGLLHQVKST